MTNKTTARTIGRRSLIAGAAAGPLAARRLHDDAVDGADGQAELAAGAVRLDDDVQALGTADDAVDRAGRQAQRAADAGALVDHREAARSFLTRVRIERDDRAAREGREPPDAFGTPGLAAVDLRRLAGERLGIGTAVGIAAARALRLRQRAVERLGEGSRGWHATIMASAADGTPGAKERVGRRPATGVLVSRAAR